MAEELDVGHALLLGKGEAAAGGRQKRSILSDAFEAIIGAVYLDGGADVAYDFVQRLLGRRIVDTVHALGALDHKTALQELAVRLYDTPPLYRMRDEGPDHAKRFFAQAEVAGRAGDKAKGRSKKQAEQAAPAKPSRPWSPAGRRPPRPDRRLSAAVPNCPRSRPSAAASRSAPSGGALSGSRSAGNARCDARRARRSSTA